MRLLFSLLAALVLTVPAFAQVEINDDGNVGIGPLPSSEDKLSINTTGDPSSYVKTALRTVSEGTGSYINIGLYATADGNNPRAADFGGDVDISGDLSVNGTIYNNSDRRLKQDVQALEKTGGLAKLKQLNPVSFRYKNVSQLQAAGYEGMKLPAGKQFGFVAQEVEQVLPEIVAERKHIPIAKARNGERPEIATYKGMNYVDLIPVLVQAVQEQQAQIEALREEVRKLREKR